MYILTEEYYNDMSSSNCFQLFFFLCGFSEVFHFVCRSNRQFNLSNTSFLSIRKGRRRVMHSIRN